MRGRVFNFVHIVALAMTNDKILEFYHPLLSETAQVGAATLPLRPIYPILPYLRPLGLPQTQLPQGKVRYGKVPTSL